MASNKHIESIRGVKRDYSVIPSGNVPMDDIVFVLMNVISWIIILLFMKIQFSPKRLARLARATYDSFRYSVQGKHGGYVKNRDKLNVLMQDFAINELAPEMAGELMPGVPPIVVKWLAKKINDSELGEFLREHPEMIPDAVSFAGDLISRFQEGQASQSLATPGEGPDYRTGPNSGW